MRTLEHDTAIEQYYEEVKHLYPGVDFDRFRLVCRAPFQYVKKCMASLSMPKIRIKYIGTFRVFQPRIKKALKILEIANDRGMVAPEGYKHRKEWLTEYLKRLQDDKEGTDSNQEVELIQD